MTMYFMGRLDGRVPKLDIQRLLVDEARKFTTSDYASEQPRCGARLAETGQQITRIGLEMSKPPK